MTANDHGPAHYKSSYHHWDLVLKVPLGYLEGCTTKYVTRWRKKNGKEDLLKALHYLDKLIEVATYDKKRDLIAIDWEIELFANANHLNNWEHQYIFILCSYRDVKALNVARRILVRELNLIKENAKEEVMSPGSPEDGGHHATQEDNSHPA